MKHMHSLRHFLILGFLALVFSACSSMGENDPSLNGQWSGSATRNGVTLSLDLLLTQDGNSIGGNGVFELSNSEGSASDPVSISGTYNFPNISLFISVGSNPPISLSYTGAVTADDDNIAGIIEGSGIVDLPLSIERD